MYEPLHVSSGFHSILLVMDLGWGKHSAQTGDFPSDDKTFKALAEKSLLSLPFKFSLYFSPNNRFFITPISSPSSLNVIFFYLI